MADLVPGAERFPHLFSPLTLKNLVLRNRVAISGHFAGWWVDRGLPSDEFVAYIRERCDRGVGLFVIGATSPMPGSGWMENLDDRIIPRYRACVDAAHRHGSALVAQLCHPGFGPLPGVPIVRAAPEAAPMQPAYRRPERHVPPIDELHELVRAFGAAAGRAAEAGVDGVELHSHESFLHAQMLNPMWNRRDDSYGGSLENRMRFMEETLRAMRAAIGPEMVLGVRLKADDMEQRGMDVQEYKACIRRLESLGLVDYVNLTGGDARLHHGPAPREEGEWLPLVREHRANTRLALMHAGRVATPEMADRAVAEGIVDVVCMTKAHIADPHFTRKVFEGRLEDIRYCTRCLQVCHGRMHRMTCVYNPLTSREWEWSELPPAVVAKRIVVIGGGPAGMEAAITAAARGHTVVVIEQSGRVGGQVWAAAGSEIRRPWARIAEFYARQAASGRFEVRLDTVATPELVAGLRPDAVIVATGSTPARAAIPGGRETATVNEVLAGEWDARLGRSAVVLDRSSFYRAAAAADYLASRRVAVRYVTTDLRVGSGVESMVVDEWVRRLEERGVTFHPGTDLAEWRGDGRALLRDVQTSAEVRLDGIDLVVGIVGAVACDRLSAPLREIGIAVHVIGDANQPQTVETATYQGARVGRLL